MHIDRKELGGQIKIDFFSTGDLRAILDLINKSAGEKRPEEMLENYIDKNNTEADINGDDRTKDEIRKEENSKADENDIKLYDISNFNV